MRNEHLLGAFFVFSTAALVATWWYVSGPAYNVGGALYGIPGTEPMGPLMAALLVVWFILAATVAVLNKPHHDE